MEQFLIDNRSIVEGIAFLSTLVIAIVGVIGLRQVYLFKIDIRSRNNRAAKEKAIEASSSYLNEFCAMTSAFLKYKIDNKLGTYEGPITTFTKDSIPKDKLDKSLERFKSSLWLNSLNKLESISAVFANGIGDEKLGFQIIGRSFCSTVENYYDLISLCRDRGACDYWENIIYLYKTWRPRLTKAELEVSKKKMEEAISELKESSIDCIDPKI